MESFNNDQNGATSDVAQIRQNPVPSKRELHDDLMFEIEKLQLLAGKKPAGWFKKDRKTAKKRDRKINNDSPLKWEVPLRVRMIYNGQLNVEQLEYSEILLALRYAYIFSSDSDEAVGGKKDINLKRVVDTPISNVDAPIRGRRGRRNYWDSDLSFCEFEEVLRNAGQNMEQEINRFTPEHPFEQLHEFEVPFESPYRCDGDYFPSREKSQRFFSYNMSRLILKSNCNSYYDAFSEFVDMLHRPYKGGDYAFHLNHAFLVNLMLRIRAKGISITPNFRRISWMVRDRDIRDPTLNHVLRHIYLSPTLHKTSLLYTYSRINPHVLAAMIYARTQAHIYYSISHENDDIYEYLSSVERICRLLLFKHSVIQVHQCENPDRLSQYDIEPTCRNEQDCANPFCPTSDSNPRYVQELPEIKSTGFYDTYFKTYVDSLKSSFSRLYELAESVLSRLDSFMSGVSGFLTSIIDYIKSIWNTFMQPIISLFTRTNFEKSMPEVKIAECLSAALFLVLSTVFEDVKLKSLCHILFFVSLRVPGDGIYLLKKVLTKIGEYMDFTPTSSGEDHDSIFSMLFSSFDETSFAALGSFLMVAFCGVKYSKDIHTSFAKVSSDAFRNLHFIGGGLIGIERIIKYFKSLMTVVRKFLYKMRGEVPIENKLLDKISVWSTKVRAFKTEAGIHYIRSSRKTCDEIIDLYNEGILYYKMCFEDKLPPRIASEIVQVHKESRDLFNIVSRMKRMGRGRFTPFHIQLCGEPGIGKTTLIQLLVRLLKNLFYPDLPDEMLTYSRGEGENWDGYHGQKILLKDEAYSMRDAKMLVEWLSIISCNPLLTPQAELYDKGNIYMESDFVISSTNVMWPDCSEVYDITAIHRRRHFLVQMVMDEDVKDAGSGKFDQRLFDEKYPGKDSHDFPHVKFTICKPVNDKNSANPGTYVATETLPSGLSFPLDNLSLEDMMTMLHSRRSAMRMEEERLMGSYLRNIEMNLDFIEIRRNVNRLYKDRENEIPRIFKGLEDPGNEGPIFDKNYDVLYDDFVKNRLGSLTVDLENSDEDEIEPTSKKKTSREKTLEYCFQNKLLTVTQALQYVDEDYFKMEQFKEIYNLRSPMFDLEPPLPVPLPLIRTIPRPEGLPIDYEGLYDTLRKIMENEAKVVNVEDKEEFKDAVEEHVKSETEEERRRRILTKLIEENKQGAAAKIKRANESQEAREIFPGKLDTSDRLFNKTHIPIDLSCGDNAYVMLENDLNIGGVTVPKLLTLSQMRQMNKAMSLGSVWPNVYIDGGYGGRSRSNVSMFFLRSLVVEGGNVFISLRGIGYFARSLCKMNGASYSDAIKFIIMHYLTTPCIAESFMYLRTYTFEEQISLIKLAHEQFIAYAYFRNFSQILTEKTKETIVSFRERLRGGWYWFWDQVGPYKNSIFILLTSLLAVSAVSSFASMLKPASTSRTYFGRAVRTRGVVPTNNTLDILTSIRHKVKDCLQEVEFRRCDDNVVYGRASVNVQRIDRYLIVPAHVFHSLGKQKDTYLMCSLRPTYNSMDLWEYIILDSHIMFVENKDIAILYVPQMPPAPDLSNMLMTKQEWATHEMPSTMHSFYRLGNELVTQDLTDLQILHEPICYNTGEEYNGPYLQLHGHIEKGASGSPVLAKIPKGRCVFAGFLSGKNKMGTVWATVLTREEYSDTIKKFRNFKPVFHEGACAVTEFTPTSLNGHCSQYITEHVQVVGLVPKGRILGQVDKTSYIKTPISTKFSSERKPAILSYRDPACIDQHPLQHSVNKTGRGIMKDMHPKYYVKASAWLSDWITGIATARHRTIDVEYNYEFIIRGTNGAKPIDVSTSPGIPYVWDRYAGKPPGKRAYIDYNEEGHITTLDPTMLNNCKSIDSMIRRGVLPPLMNYEFPKDELRPIGKSTRSVTVMPLEVTMLYRKYNMGLDSFLHSLSDGSFPICVGMDIHSRAWTMIYNNLLKNSPTACDMDVSGWDGHWPYWLHDATSWVTEDIYEFFHRNHSCDDCFGNPEGVYCDVYREERWARKSISEYNLYGPSQFGDIILQKWRGMSSGYPGTADKNSMSHLLLILTLYILHCERCNRLDMKRLQIFRENVVCFVYGDDILISIKDSFKPFFSYENLISLYEEFGWPCTSSSKQGEITEKPVNLCVFLKHQFILDINFGKAWVHAALDEQVIADLCYWIRKTTKPRTQLYENLDTALEYKYSHGKEKFNMLRTRILLACREKNILMILPEFDYYHEVLIKRHFDV